MMLTREKSTINTLAGAFAISRPAISKHVKVLVDTGFVTIQQNGRERICSLNPAGFVEVRAWVGHFEQFWMQQMSNLEVLLNAREGSKSS